MANTNLEDNRWIDIAPQHNFLGSCEATIEVSDSLHSTGDTFQVIVVPVVEYHEFTGEGARVGG